MAYKELGKNDFMKKLNIKEKEIPALLIVEGTWKTEETTRMRAKKLRNARMCWMPNVILGKYNGNYVACSCVYGPSMASQVVHFFAAIGTKNVIQIGSYGGLQKGMKISDFLIPKYADREDGVSDFYLKRNVKADSSEKLNRMLKDICKRYGIENQGGKMITISTMLAETKEMISLWQKKGYKGVDMETAAIFSTAKHFGINRCAFLRMVDNVVENKNTFLKLSEKEKKMVDEGANIIFDVALKLSEKL